MLSHRFQQSPYTWLWDSLFLLVVLGCLTFLFLGSRPLFVPDEGRYAEIAREMVNNHDFITPYLNGIKYFEKPILFYWLTAGAIKLTGLNLWSIRSVNGILSLMGCLATYYTGRKLFDRETGLLAAFILGTNFLYFIMSHMISLDLPVSVFLSVSLYAVVLAFFHENKKYKFFYIFFSAAMAACAVLTKGLIGIVFPVLIIFTWTTCVNKWQSLKQLNWIVFTIVFLSITAPWHILVSVKNPEFPYFYFVEQHFLRYSTPNVGHYQPSWFFIPFLIIGFFPWIVFLPQTFMQFLRVKRDEKYSKELFFLVWVIVVFTFFSFSKSKLIPYILPIFPALALLVARYLTMQMQQKARLGITIAYLILLAFNLALMLFFYFYLKHTFFYQAKFYLIIATLIFAIGIFFANFFIHHALHHSLALTIFCMGIFLLLLTVAMPTLDNRSILPLANTLKPILSPHDEVITYNQYYQDLPFYLERRVSILNWRNELTYGMKHQRDKEWMLNDEKYWQLWSGQQRVFVLISRDELQKKYFGKPFYLLNHTLNTALISNLP